MPRPIPREPPVTNAVFPLSVIKAPPGPESAAHVRAARLPSQPKQPCLARRLQEKMFSFRTSYERTVSAESHLNLGRVQRTNNVRYAGMAGRAIETNNARALWSP